jgi:hypothetical protein
MKKVTQDAASFCEGEIERMLKNSQTKVIVPVITLALLREFLATGRQVFTDSDIRKCYEAMVRELKRFLGHDVHIGAKYYDAYGLRMSRYRVLKSVGHLKYELETSYLENAPRLCKWIPEKIREHISNRLGVIPTLGDATARLALAESKTDFLTLLNDHIGRTPSNFEIFCFAVLRVHLEKFACKIYRDTRTAAHDRGVDLSTNYGVVYQIKKLQILTSAEAEQICTELKLNFDNQRLNDGNVVLVIDDISKEQKQFLINMKVQSISKAELLNLAANFDDIEDRQKLLRIVYEEFRREYSSDLK